MRGSAAAAGAIALLAAAGPAGSSVLAEERTLPAAAVRGSFLEQAGGARAGGMGDAFTALADDTSGAHWNPAGLGRQAAAGASASWRSLGEGASLSTVAVGVPLGPVVAGFSLNLFQPGAYDERDASGALVATRSLNDAAGALTCAFRTPRLPGWSGVTVEAVSESIAGTTLGLSVGGIVPVSTRLTAGWSLRHLSGRPGGFGLPATVRAGAAYAVFPSLRAAGDFGFGLVDHQPLVAAGVEYAPFSLLAIRAGYRFAGGYEHVTGITGLTAGLGAAWRTLRLDYAYAPFGDLATHHRVSMAYAWGRARAAVTRPLARPARKAASGKTPARKAKPPSSAGK